MDSDDSMLSSPLSAFVQSPSPPTSTSSTGNSVSPSSGRVAAVDAHAIPVAKISSGGNMQKTGKMGKTSQAAKKTESSSFQVLLKAPPPKSTTTKMTKRARTALPDSQPEKTTKRRKLVDSRPAETSPDALNLPKNASKTTKNPAKPIAEKKKATAKQPAKTATAKATPGKATTAVPTTKGPKVRTTEYLDFDEACKDLGGSAQNPETVKLDMLLNALRKKKKIVVIAGAGISVSAGIPDFRSGHGLFKTLKSEHKLKASGKQLFDASVYKDNNMTESFHAMVRKLSDMTKAAEPTPFHHMLASLAEEGRLLRLYTQNIDCIDTSLEPLATNVPLNHKGPWPTTIQLHGSVRHMVCSKCSFLSELQSDLFEGPVPPSCARCHEEEMLRVTFANKRQQGVGKLRPRIVLYNEGNPDEEAIGAVSLADLRARPDAVLVVGTTMKIPGLKRLAKELCAVTRGRRDGFTAWINLDPEPQSSDLRDCWDLVVKARCDDVATLLSLPRWDEYRAWAAANAASTLEVTTEDEKAARASKLEISLPGLQEQNTSDTTAKTTKRKKSASTTTTALGDFPVQSSSCSAAPPNSPDAPLDEGSAADADSGLAADANCSSSSSREQKEQYQMQTQTQKQTQMQEQPKTQPQPQSKTQPQNQNVTKTAAAETACAVSAQESSFPTSTALYGKVATNSNSSSCSNKAAGAEDPAELALAVDSDAGDDHGGSSAGTGSRASAVATGATGATGAAVAVSGAVTSATSSDDSGAPCRNSRDYTPTPPVNQSGFSTNTTTTSNAAGFKKLLAAAPTEDAQLDRPASSALTRVPSATSSYTAAPPSSISIITTATTASSPSSFSSTSSAPSHSSSSLITIPAKTIVDQHKNKNKQQSKLLFTSTKRIRQSASTLACVNPSPSPLSDSTSDSGSAPSRSSLDLCSSASSSSSPPPPLLRKRSSKPRAAKQIKSSVSGPDSSHTPSSSSNPLTVFASASTIKEQTTTLTSRCKISTFVTTIKKSSSLAYRSQPRSKVPRPITVESTNQSSGVSLPALAPDVSERHLSPKLSITSPPLDSVASSQDGPDEYTVATAASDSRDSLDTFNSSGESDVGTDSDTMAGKDESGGKKRTKKYGPTFKVAPMPPPAVPVEPVKPFKMSEIGSDKPYKCTASSASASNQAQTMTSSTTMVKPALPPPPPKSAVMSTADTISPSTVPRGMESLLD